MGRLGRPGRRPRRSRSTTATCAFTLSRCRPTRSSGTTEGSPTRSCGRCSTAVCDEVELNRAWWHSYRIVNRRFAAAVCTDRPARWHRVGSRLPPAAGAGDDPGEAARPATSACSCTSRSRTRSCSRCCRGARKSSEACSAPTCWGSRCPKTSPTSSLPPSGWSTRAPAGTSLFDGVHVVDVDAFPISVDFAHWDVARRQRPRQRRRSIARSSASSRSSRASIVSTTPKGSRSDCGRSASCSTTGCSITEKCAFVQVAVPSRADVAAYEDERDEVENADRRDQRQAPARPMVRCRSSTWTPRSTRSRWRRGSGPPTRWSSPRWPTG